MLSLATILCGLVLAVLTEAQISLGSAGAFGLVANTAITTTGKTVIRGEVAIWPNGLSSITGFPPGVSGTQYGADATAETAHDDAQTVYNNLVALTPTMDLTGKDLGGMTLESGVYSFSSSGGLTGTLTLDAQGDANALFVFQCGSTLTTAASAQVVIINSGKACNVYWQVGSSATLGTGTNFIGNVLAFTSITVNKGVVSQGGLYAVNAAITLTDDQVASEGSCGGTVQ